MESQGHQSLGVTLTHPGIKIGFTAALLLLAQLSLAKSDHFYQEAFKNKTGCFLIVDINTKETVYSFNSARCEERLPPMSTFKIPLAIMAFDSQLLKSVDQTIEWDGTVHSRPALNQNQTSKNFMQNSVIWVSQWIVDSLGKQIIQKYIDQLDYGNRKVDGDLKTFWLSDGSIKISAREQVDFISKLWNNELPITKESLEKIQETIFIQEISDQKVYGKTGTGCIDLGCMEKPGRQLGWFVGVVQNDEKSYAFALNFSDHIPAERFGGIRAREIVLQYLKQSS